jgi:histidine triad (HIT) family protein
VADLWQAAPTLGADLIAGVIRVGRAIEAALTPEGMNLITSAGEAAEQTVFHLHFHIVPRWRRDGFGRIWPAAKRRFEDADLDDLASNIRGACSDIEA